MDLEEKKDMNEQKQHVNVFVGAETGLLKGKRKSFWMKNIHILKYSYFLSNNSKLKIHF